MNGQDENGAAEMLAANPLGAAIDAALEKLADPALTPVGALRTIIERARAMPVHESRHAEAAAAVAEFTRAGVEALRANVGNVFASSLLDLTRRFHALAAPPPQPPEIDRIGPRLRSIGWASLEIDLLGRMLRPGERVEGFDLSGVRLATRTLTRRAIRDGGRPAWYASAPGWRQAEWEAQFQPSALNSRRAPGLARMAIHVEKHPVETAAREAAMALRLSILPIEEACAALGRIALVQFESPEAEADFAEQLRELARSLRARNQAEGATARSILKGIQQLALRARLLATAKQGAKC